MVSVWQDGGRGRWDLLLPHLIGGSAGGGGVCGRVPDSPYDQPDETWDLHSARKTIDNLLIIIY